MSEGNASATTAQATSWLNSATLLNVIAILKMSSDVNVHRLSMWTSSYFNVHRLSMSGNGFLDYGGGKRKNTRKTSESMFFGERTRT